MLEHSVTTVACLGITKSGNPCRAKATSSGYCPIHDPAKIAKLEQERQAREAEKQAEQSRCKPLREIITLMSATCERKGWRVLEKHFDNETGQYASLEVKRYSNINGIYEAVTGVIDVSFHKGHSIRSSLQGTSFYKHGIDDLQKAIELEIERKFGVSKKPPQPATPDVLQKLENLLRRFHLVAHQLTQRHDSRQTLLINDEYDVQYLLHALLHTLFDDIRPEDPVPNHAGKSSRMDFLLKREKIMVEAKMTRKNLCDAEVGEQLIIDIKRYQACSDCNTLVCFVYDPGHYLKNPRGLEADLSRKHDNLSVRVIIYSP